MQESIATQEPELSDYRTSAEFFRGELGVLEGKDCVRIFVDEHTTLELVAEDHHRAQWPDEWRHYTGDGSDYEGQTRIENIPWIERSWHVPLRKNRIYTVEHLAAVPDSRVASMKMSSFLALRERARKFVREEGSVARKQTDMEQEMKEMRALIEEQRKMISDLTAPPEPASKPTPKRAAKK